jgi:polygalacturonase
MKIPALIGALGLCACLAWPLPALAQDSPPAATSANVTMPEIPHPSIPSLTFNITDHGAVGDGVKMNTKAIQDTIDACSRAGGGTVDIPAGKFLTGPFTLASNLNLRLEKDATLLLSNNFSDYPLDRGQYQHCISVSNAHDIEISGEGTIDGQGQPWWAAFKANKDTFPHRPHLIVLSNCQRVWVHDITLTNSPSFHLVPRSCTDVVIEHVTIVAPGDSPNTDAIDPSGWNLLITKCTLDVGDDNVAVKAGGRPDPARPSCENFLITDCTMLHGHGLSVGSETSGGLRNLRAENCTFNGTVSGIRLKSNSDVGGLCENLTYDHLTMTNVHNPIYITSYYPKEPATPEADPTPSPARTTPVWRDVTISNVTITDCPVAGIIWGLPELPVDNVTFDHVTISANTGMKIYHATRIKFVDSQIDVKKGEKVFLDHAEVTGLEPAPDAATSTPAGEK